MIYGSEAARQFRERQAQVAMEPERQPSLLAQIRADAPMDDATLTVWNGARFVAYEKWLATAPIVREANRPATGAAAIPAHTTCVAGVCGGTPVWLVKDGDRWLMHAGSRTGGGRRRDFASPFLGHAIRTAEQWYGGPGGWRAEARDGKTKAADLSPQDSTDEEGAGERGHDDVDLDGRESGR